MSYDLFLQPAASHPETDYGEYFNQRAHYSVKDGQAFYENEDTGVHFYFDYSSSEASVAFNLNYYRPHIFGLEAGVEVEAFVSAFRCAVDDPQSDGMGEGPFTMDGFLSGWNSGNRFAYGAILSQAGRPETFAYPTEQLEASWRWNFHRAAVQESVGEALFVPRIMFVKGAGVARSALVWPDACPIYIPKTDLIIVFRHEYSTTPDAEDPRQVLLVEWSELAPLIKSYPYDQAGYFRLEYDEWPTELVDRIQSLPLVPFDRELGLASDSVLNAELVAEATCQSR